MVRAAMKERLLIASRLKCTRVPIVFCLGVAVGCKVRIACTWRRIAEELSSGWAEKKINGCEKMPDQTRATKIHMPACATVAVPNPGSVTVPRI